MQSKCDAKCSSELFYCEPLFSWHNCQFEGSCWAGRGVAQFSLLAFVLSTLAENAVWHGNSSESGPDTVNMTSVQLECSKMIDCWGSVLTLTSLQQHSWMQFPNSPMFSMVGVNQGSHFSGLQERGCRADHLASTFPAHTVQAQHESREFVWKGCCPHERSQSKHWCVNGKLMQILPEEC